jgi:hypothetical protein
MRRPQSGMTVRIGAPEVRRLVPVEVVPAETVAIREDIGDGSLTGIGRAADPEHLIE